MKIALFNEAKEGLIMSQQPIGFFDSGVGGLTVLKAALAKFPNENTIYIADENHLPYGPRPAAEVKRFAWQITSFLLDKDIKMLIIACNTATAAALADLQAKLAIPVIGVIIPGAQAAQRTTQNGTIGVIATEGTIKSNAYQKALKEIDNDSKVVNLAEPDFVTLVEENRYQDPTIKPIINDKLQPLKAAHIDTLVMGCTHFPLLRPLIQEVIGDQVTLIDPGIEEVRIADTLLDYYQLRNYSKTLAQHLFYTTGTTAHFDKIAQQWLQQPQLHSQHLDLGSD